MWSIAELVIELLADDVPKWVKEQRDRLRARYILFRLRREHWMEKECRDARFCRALIHKHYPRCLLFDLHYRKQLLEMPGMRTDFIRLVKTTYGES